MENLLRINGLWQCTNVVVLESNLKVQSSSLSERRMMLQG
jgi:hypothetical protein